MCFTGIDGSGKSTLARELVATLERRGIKSDYVHSGFQPLLTKPLIRIARSLFLPGKDPFSDYNESASTRRRLFKNRLSSLIYESLLLSDYVFQAMVKVKVPLIIGRNIVCDRYVYDAITHLAVDMSYPQQKIDRMLGRLFLLLPKPDLTFLIDVPEEIAFGRKNDVPSIEYLKERRDVYLNVGAKHRMTILDGSKNLRELQFEIECKVFP